MADRIVRTPPAPTSERYYRWSAKEVVRDLHGVPHLLLRISLEGPAFPHRAGRPFVRVGGVESRLVLIGEDSLVARGYFDRLPPEGGAVEFGYGRRVLFRFPRPFRASRAARLDRAKLPEATRTPREL